MIEIVVLVIFAFHSPAAGQPLQQSTNNEENLNLARIAEQISRTSPEGLEIIDRARKSIPEIQSHLSAKNLGAAVEDWINGRGDFNINPIGWAASKTTTGDWMLSFYFEGKEGKLTKATWEYKPERNVLLPAEFTNATMFWVRRSENKRP